MLVREITSESSSFHRCQGSIDEFTLSGKCGIGAIYTSPKFGRKEKKERVRYAEQMTEWSEVQHSGLSGFAFRDKR